MSKVENSLVASARRIGGVNINTAKNSRQAGAVKAQEWQQEAWDYYDLVGELHFLVNTLAGQLSRAVLYVGYQEDFNAEPERVEDESVTKILEAVGDARGRTSQMLYRMAVNLYISGECWFVGIPKVDTSTGRRPNLDGLDVDSLEWRVLSTSEVKLNGQDSVKIELDAGDTPEIRLEDLFLIRIWREHPRKSWEADSSVRSSLPILSELVKLTMHVSAQTDSRLAGAGILVVPQSAQNALRSGADVVEDTTEDYFTEALIDAMSTAIQDRASASAIVPVVATVPDESAGKIEHISFATNLDSEARNLREEALRRLALSLDAPPEVLLGTSSMNHWGGWLVKEETVSTHLENPLALICDALTTSYLWVMLRGLGVEEEEVTKYSICYDVDHLITRPSLSGDAKDLYNAGVISEETLRRATGFDESDAPEKPLSLARETALRMVENDPSLVYKPGLEALVNQLASLIAGDSIPSLGGESTKEADTVQSEPENSVEETENDSTENVLPDTADKEPEIDDAPKP